jgi:hypothetical protein
LTDSPADPILAAPPVARQETLTDMNDSFDPGQCPACRRVRILANGWHVDSPDPALAVSPHAADHAAACPNTADLVAASVLAAGIMMATGLPVRIICFGIHDWGTMWSNTEEDHVRLPVGPGTAIWVAVDPGAADPWRRTVRISGLANRFPAISLVEQEAGGGKVVEYRFMNVLDGTGPDTLLAQAVTKIASRQRS